MVVLQELMADLHLRSGVWVKSTKTKTTSCSREGCLRPVLKARINFRPPPTGRLPLLPLLPMTLTAA